MITAEAIAAAKTRTRYWGYTAAEFAARRSAERCAPPVHEHDDCIRIAYEWLDAQKKTKNPRWPRHYMLKHLIERWAGRYVSQNDVEVAAELHPEIRGVYPSYNIGARLVWPSEVRLAGIGQAMKQPNYREGLSDTERKRIYGNRQGPAASYASTMVDDPRLRPIAGADVLAPAGRHHGGHGGRGARGG